MRAVTLKYVATHSHGSTPGHWHTAVMLIGRAAVCLSAPRAPAPLPDPPTLAQIPSNACGWQTSAASHRSALPDKQASAQPTPDTATRIHNYADVCWWASRDDSISHIPSLDPRPEKGMREPTSPSGAGGAALSRLPVGHKKARSFPGRHFERGKGWSGAKRTKGVPKCLRLR